MIKENMSGKKPNTTLEKALSNIPAIFKSRIIKQYLEIKMLYREKEYEISCMKVGKFCETVIRFLQNSLTAKYIPFGEKINNFIIECDKLTSTPKTSGNESLRVLIPHSLKFLYSIRSKRGICHVSGDVDPNEMDSTACISLVDWIMAELIRIYHGLSIEDAKNVISKLIKRNISYIWEVSGKKRILDITLSTKDKSLVLLYSEPKMPVPVNDLFEWTEYSRLNLFKTNILYPLHKNKFIEYDKKKESVWLSPKGSDEAEKIIHANEKNNLISK